MLGVSLFVVSSNSIVGESKAATGFSISEDPSTGYITAENDTAKVVWHYKTLPSEYSNRGGGNIYELYDKRTDPQMQHNMVAIVNYGTSGTGPARSGHGGLGSTYVYESGSGAAYADNGHLARLVGKNSFIDGDGNAVLEISYIIRSAVSPYPDDYRVDKRWVVFPNGQIKLSLSMQFLRTFVATEPTYSFAFSHDYGWNTADTWGHKWDTNICGGSGSDGNANHYDTEQTFNNIDQSPDIDHQLLHSEKFGLFGKTGGDSVSVRMDNDGKGFENGGLFGLGASLWHTSEDPTVEYSNFTQLAYGHTVHFYAWWGGERTADRYKQVQAGTSWSDTLWIEMQPAPAPPPTQITGNVSVGNVGESQTVLRWDTNLASDSTVSYWPSGSVDQSMVNSSAWTPQHQITLSGLMPGTTYGYEVASHNGSGLAVKTGTFTTTDVLKLTVSEKAVYWASYQDYVNGSLTADFSVANNGIQPAYSVEALQVRASADVTGTIRTPAIDIIPAGESRNFLVLYKVGSSVTSFNTIVYIRGVDEVGTQHYYPGLPPA